MIVDYREHVAGLQSGVQSAAKRLHTARSRVVRTRKGSLTNPGLALLCTQGLSHPPGLALCALTGPACSGYSAVPSDSSSVLGPSLACVATGAVRGDHAGDARGVRPAARTQTREGASSPNPAVVAARPSASLNDQRARAPPTLRSWLRASLSAQRAPSLSRARLSSPRAIYGRACTRA